MFISVAQNVFDNALLTGITGVAKVNSDIILHTGATNLIQGFPAALRYYIQVVYNNALRRSWYVAVAMACLTMIATLAVQWRGLKRLPIGGY